MTRTDKALLKAERIIEEARREAFSLETREETRAYLQHIADVLLDEIEAHGFNYDEDA